MSSTLLVTGADRRGSLGLAAAVAVEAAIETRAGVVLCELWEGPRRRPTLLASAAARELETRLRETGLPVSARGHLCHLGDRAASQRLPELAEMLVAARSEVAVIHLPGASWRSALDCSGLRPVGGLLLVELPRERPLAALAVHELRGRGLRARVEGSPPPALAARRALAGVRPGGGVSERARRAARALLGLGNRRRGGERGQALPALLGGCALILLAALALTSIGGAVTGKGRAQRSVDLAALSAARSMRDDLPRLLAPPRLPDGLPNPRRLSRRTYLARAEAAGEDAARRNGVAPRRLRISFPDAAAWPPLRARAEIAAEIDPRSLNGAHRGEPGEAIPVTAWAVAEAAPPTGSWSGMSPVASGGGYSGPLAYRNGEGMRPDVAAAFDRMAAAARRAGHALVVNSGFRSDAEQARLFASNPDPTWVAPPGRSLHRCATELDLGPPSAYRWLAANARRFGFVRRYSWEPWHYGFAVGPLPCAGAASSGRPAGSPGGGGRGLRRVSPDGGIGRSPLPSFVPAHLRATILRSAARWNVSAPLLAAQLMAESGFNPRAVSPAGAQGIAQFMPATARAYGLRNPFDPVAAIDAQARLMSELLRRFRSVPLALAAYNAGPGAVTPCSCVPPYPETRAYVARILALLDGAGAIVAPPLEVRLID